MWFISCVWTEHTATNALALLHRSVHPQVWFFCLMDTAPPSCVRVHRNYLLCFCCVFCAYSLSRSRTIIHGDVDVTINSQWGNMIFTYQWVCKRQGAGWVPTYLPTHRLSYLWRIDRVESKQFIWFALAQQTVGDIVLYSVHGSMVWLDTIIATTGSRDQSPDLILTRVFCFW